MSALSRPIYSRAIAILAEHTLALPCSTSESDVVRIAQLYDVSPEWIAQAVRKHWRHVQRMKSLASFDGPEPWQR